MGPAEKGIRAAKNGMSPLRQLFLEILIDVLYGRKTSASFDANALEDPKKRQKLVQETNFLKDPSVTSLAESLIVLNSYDLCNPFSFMLTQVLPDGNPIKEGFLKLDGLARTWQSISAGNFLGGGGTVSIPITLPPDNTITFTGNQKFSFGMNLSNKQAKQLDLNDSVVVFQEDDKAYENYSLIGEVIAAAPIPNLLSPASPPLGKLVTINVQRASISKPPFLTDQQGNLIKDERENPIPRKFQKLRLEVKRDPNPTQEVLSDGLIEIAKALEEVGFEDLIETIESLPPYFPNMEGLKKTTKKLVKFQRLLRPIIANASNTALVGRFPEFSPVVINAILSSSLLLNVPLSSKTKIPLSLELNHLYPFGSTKISPVLVLFTKRLLRLYSCHSEPSNATKGLFTLAPGAPEQVTHSTFLSSKVDPPIL